MSFFEYKAYQSKQGAGIVSYVKPLARNNAVFGKNRVDLAIALALEGRADSIRALLCVSRTYVDIFSGAVALAVVVHAILNRAIDALDVLFALVGVIHHNSDPFVIYIIVCPAAAFTEAGVARLLPIVLLLSRKNRSIHFFKR